MTDIMPNDFTSFIINFKPYLPFLPLTHTTDASRFKKHILKESLLRPQPCDMFNEDLLYFFYGYPAYRINSETKSLFNGKLPIAIILHPEAVKYAKRIFPFDSGAYGKKLLPEYMYEDYTINSFLVEFSSNFAEYISIPDIPAQIISAFFENNTNYYLGNKVRKFSGSELSNSFESECYYELISAKSECKSDERRSRIEIQIGETVILSKDSVWAVVLPESSLDNKILEKTVVKIWEAKPITYPSYNNTPSFFIPIIIQKVFEFFRERGLI